MQYIAHRGASYFEPENTLRSIKRAIDLGADWVEVDVRLTQDQELVIIHDPTLERTTNGRGRVDDHTLKELVKLDAGKGEKIPTLKEVFELVRDETIGLVLELKVPGTEDMILNMVDQSGISKIMIVSFYHPSLLTIKDIYPEIKTGIIFRCQPVRPERLALDASADFIFPHYDFINQNMVDMVHKQDIGIFPWIVDYDSQLEVTRSLNVDGIVTNKLFKFL